jgi:hypothetical protein
MFSTSPPAPVQHVATGTSSASPAAPALRRHRPLLYAAAGPYSVPSRRWLPLLHARRCKLPLLPLLRAARGLTAASASAAGRGSSTSAAKRGCGRRPETMKMISIRSVVGGLLRFPTPGGRGRRDDAVVRPS